MELDASKLAVDGLTVKLAGPRGTERVIVLAPSRGVTGSYRSDDEAVRLDAQSREALALSAARWTLDGGDISLEGEAALSRPIVKLTFPRTDGGTRGEVACGAITAGGIAIALDGLTQPIRVASPALENAGLALDGKGSIGIVAEALEARRVSLSIGGTEVIIEGLTAAELRVHKPAGGKWKVEAKSLEAQRIAVEVGALSVVIDEPAVGRLSWKSGGNIELGALETPALQVQHRSLSASGERAPEPPPADAPKRSRSRLDLTALDQLAGKLDLDITADTTVPVIGSRRATHHFRLAVDHGTIDYYKLEKSLSRLEDALLDFEVQGHKLALVVDLALKKKTIVSWKLSDDEVELAHRRLVKLRRLIHYQLPPSSGDSSAFEIRELLFDNIDIQLRMLAGGSMTIGRGKLHFGSEEQKAAIRKLQIRGRVCHRPARRGHTPPAGRLDIAGEKLALGADDLNIGSRRLTVQALSIGAIDKTSLTFAGFSPAALDTTIRELEVRQLVITPPR